MITKAAGPVLNVFPKAVNSQLNEFPKAAANSIDKSAKNRGFQKPLS
jgi:hypothetical protein